MRRGLTLGLGAVCVFVVVAAIMLRLMPGPPRESDYLVIGSVATLVSLLALFLALVSTTLKSSDIFFKRRKK
jgi:NADH:ubiquinone oxidoreductase subunit 6 (subunit J)